MFILFLVFMKLYTNLLPGSDRDQELFVPSSISLSLRIDGGSVSSMRTSNCNYSTLGVFQKPDFHLGNTTWAISGENRAIWNNYTKLHPNILPHCLHFQFSQSPRHLTHWFLYPVRDEMAYLWDLWESRREQQGASRKMVCWCSNFLLVQMYLWNLV